MPKKPPVLHEASDAFEDPPLPPFDARPTLPSPSPENLAKLETKAPAETASVVPQEPVISQETTMPRGEYKSLPPLPANEPDIVPSDEKKTLVANVNPLTWDAVVADLKPPVIGDTVLYVSDARNGNGESLPAMVVKSRFVGQVQHLNLQVFTDSPQATYYVRDAIPGRDQGQWRVR